LGLLLGEVEVATGDERGKMAKERREQAKGKVAERLVYWDQACVHQWYLTFTQLLAAGQFAVLGLVLMAAAARICTLLGITEFYQEFASEDMKSVLEVMEKGEAVETFGEVGAQGVQEGEASYEEEGEDFGEVLERL